MRGSFEWESIWAAYLDLMFLISWDYVEMLHKNPMDVAVKLEEWAEERKTFMRNWIHND